jgi:hypothetical protein
MEPIANIKEEIEIATSAGATPRIWDKKLYKHKSAK